MMVGNKCIRKTVTEQFSDLVKVYKFSDIKISTKSWSYDLVAESAYYSMEDQVQFLAPTLGSSQSPVTPLPRHPTPSSGLCRHLRSHKYTHIQADT